MSPEGIARVTMTDATGALRLERDLDLPKSGAPGGGGAREHGGSCAAVAETVALIVERYMRHLGYHEPPAPALVEPPRPPPPPPVSPPPPARPLGGPGRLGLGAAARVPYAESARLEAWLTGAIRLGHLDLAAALGAALPEDEAVPLSASRGTLHLLTFPARVWAGWSLPIGRRFAVVPAVGVGVDFVVANTGRIDMTRRSTALEPTLEAGFRAFAALTQRVWIDLQAFQGIDVRPEQFTVMLPNGPENVFVTPRAYARLGVDFGVFLGKN
jgi:hypothetical protein